MIYSHYLSFWGVRVLHKLFRIKEYEDIETMFSRFQPLVSSLHVLNKSYTTPYHVKNIEESSSQMET